MVYNNSVYIINMMSRQAALPKEEQEVNNDAETSG